MNNKKLKESTFSRKYEANLKKYNILSESYQLILSKKEVVKEQKIFSDKDGYNVLKKNSFKGFFKYN